MAYMVDPYSRSSHRVGEKSGGPSTLQQELASVMRDRRARGLAHDYSSASASNLSEDELDSDDELMQDFNKTHKRHASRRSPSPVGKSGPLAKSPTYERSNMRKSPGFEDESFSKPQKDSAIDVIFGNREKETDKGVKKSKDTPWQPPGSQIRKSPVSPKERRKLSTDYGHEEDMIDFRKGKGYSPYDGDDRAERSRDYKEGFPGFRDRKGSYDKYTRDEEDERPTPRPTPRSTPRSKATKTMKKKYNEQMSPGERRKSLIDHYGNDDGSERPRAKRRGMLSSGSDNESVDGRDKSYKPVPRRRGLRSSRDSDEEIDSYSRKSGREKNKDRKGGPSMDGSDEEVSRYTMEGENKYSRRRSPFSGKDHDGRDSFTKKEGDRKSPFSKRDDRKSPFSQKEYDRRSPYSKDEDDKRSPYSKKDDRKSPFPKAEERKSPFSKKESDRRSPFSKKDDRKSPYSKTEDRKSPYSNKDSDRRNLFSKKEEDRRSPYAKRENGKSPFSKSSRRTHFEDGSDENDSDNQRAMSKKYNRKSPHQNEDHLDRYDGQGKRALKYGRRYGDDDDEDDDEYHLRNRRDGKHKPWRKEDGWRSPEKDKERDLNYRRKPRHSDDEDQDCDKERSGRKSDYLGKLNDEYDGLSRKRAGYRERQKRFEENSDSGEDEHGSDKGKGNRKLRSEGHRSRPSPEDSDSEDQLQKTQSKRRGFTDENSSVCEDTYIDPTMKQRPTKEGLELAKKEPRHQTKEKQHFNQAIDTIKNAQDDRKMQYIDPDNDDGRKSKRPGSSTKIKPKPRYIKPQLQKDTTVNLSNLKTTIDIRDCVYQQWYEERMSSSRLDKKEKIKKEKEEQERIEQAKRQKLAEAKASYNSWLEQKNKRIAQENKIKAKREREKQQKELEEKKEKREIAKKTFKIWEEDKKITLQEQHYKKLKEQKRKEREEIEKTMEKRKDAEAAFKCWDANKSEVLKDKKTGEDREKRKKMSYEQKLSRQREKEAARSYEKWMEKKENQLQKSERIYNEDYDEMTEKQPWRPSSSTIPFGR